MNTTTLKLLFLLGVVSFMLLSVNARAVEQAWEVDDFDDENSLDFDGYDREVRQPLRYGKRRIMDKLSHVTYGDLVHPPYYQNSHKGRK